MTLMALPVRLIAGAPVALEDHPLAERPGLDQLKPDVSGDRRQEERTTADHNRSRNMRSSSTRPIGSRHTPLR